MNKFAKQFLPLLILLAVFLGACTNPFFTALLKDKGKPGGGFSPQTNTSTANDAETLGFVGTSAVSSDTGVATVKIEDDHIGITSVTEGSATITVSADGYTNATIEVTVGADGTVTVGEIRPGVPAYTVTFESNGGSSVTAQAVAEGGTATEPPAPAKTGLSFDGWYKEAAFTNQWNFSTDTVTADITLYAKWTATVTFNTNGGSSVPAQTVAEGGKATEPPAPAKEDYLLEGWYKEAELTNQWDFITDTVTADMTLYAYWIPFKMVPVPISGSITFPTGTNDLGTATVVGAYEIGETEVTYELWYTVRAWAEGNGYTFSGNPGLEGSSAASQNTVPGANRQEPVTMVGWFDAVVWLNALTEWVNEKTGISLTPVYYYDSGYATVAKDSTYTSNFEKEDPAHAYRSAYIKPGATGFRLPTSNEWELAARWQGSDTGNTVSGYTDPYFTKGNSASGATAACTDDDATKAVAWYNSNSSSKTQAVKGRAANGLGLCDMSGNVWEWCYDWNPSYDGSYRIVRGGRWDNGASYLQVGGVNNYSPDIRNYVIGFRPARTAQ